VSEALVPKGKGSARPSMVRLSGGLHEYLGNLLLSHA
jgi:hypothetical protein